MGQTCDCVMAYSADCLHMQCLPLPLSLKPPAESTKQILAAPAKPPTPTGRTEQFVPGGSIYDGAKVYQVQSVLGEGTYGKVAKCIRMVDKKTVAIKMIKKRGSCVDAQKEVAPPNTCRPLFVVKLISATVCPQVQALSKLKSLDPDKCSIVRWHKHFTDRGCICLEFEYLEKSLSDFMKQRYFRPLFVKEIRPIVQQVNKRLVLIVCIFFLPIKKYSKNQCTV